MSDLTRIAQLMAEAVNGQGTVSLPERLCAACVDALAVQAASITLMADTGHRSGTWASDTRAERLEGRQFTLGEGPAVDAFRTRRPVLAPDLLAADEVRWPVLSADLVARRGTGDLRALFAFPLHLGAVCIGILGLYRTAPGTLSLAEVADVQAAATTVTLAVVGSFVAEENVVAEENGERARPWIDDPPYDGVQVDRAVGMVMVQLGVPAAEALARLRAHAFAQDREIDQIAREVVDRRLRFTEEDR
ncbi:GAF domain-containing protein [Kitasatospora sp. NPDC004240]